MTTRDTGRAARNIQAVLWDLDGTLVQTEDLHLTLEVDVLREHGIVVPRDVYRERFTGMPTRVTYALLFAEAGLDPAGVEVALARKRARAPAEIIGRAWPVRGAERVLVDIPMRTHRFALVTSAERYIAEGMFERFGWAWRFEAVITANEVTSPKPAPEPYLMACEALGVAPERALVVEDSPHGIASGRAAGCPVAGLPGTFPQEALSGATYLLSNLGALPGLLGVLG